MPRPRREIEPKMTRREMQNVTASNLKMAADLLRVHEKIWQDEWDAAANPFLAWDQYRKNKPKRVKIVNQWLQARKEYENARD